MHDYLCEQIGIFKLDKNPPSDSPIYCVLLKCHYEYHKNCNIIFIIKLA
jgi:hypothetical protein